MAEIIDNDHIINDGNLNEDEISIIILFLFAYYKYSKLSGPKFVIVWSSGLCVSTILKIDHQAT